ncbi:hypothetical protein G9A89_001762 [Geosiphon pyriformis]|nr:hypothetical protein G9A89_001762 [Geosiphon pyriformis]
MKLVDLSARGFGLVSASLGTHLNAKKNHLDIIYFYSVSCKKTKKHVASIMVDLSADLLSLEDISGAGSEIGSVNNLLDVKNMVNIMAKETSYVESGKDNSMDEVISKKTCTRTYVLGNPPKQFSFNCINNNDNKLVLPFHVILGFNKLSLIKLCATKKRNFNSSKFFMLDIELSAVPSKTVVDGFGEASTFSKFSGIIRSSFTSESNINKVKKLAIHEKIVVNDNLKKVSSHSNRKIVVKEIPVDFSKSAVESVFSKFGKIVSIKIQLIEFESFEIANLVAVKWSVFMRKDSIHVVKVINDKQSWVGTIAHDLSNLLESYGRKTCFIDCNLSFYVCDRYLIVCFVDKTFKLATIDLTLVFKGVNLCWAGLFLVYCAQCKQFGHIFAGCLLGKNSGVRDKWVVTSQDCVHLANIYKKKQAPIICPVFFGGKTWAQVAGSSSFHVVLLGFFGIDSSSDTKPVLMVSNSFGNFCLVDCLASLKCSLEFLIDQVLVIMKKLSFVKLVPLAFKLHISSLVILTFVTSNLDSDMALNDTMTSPSLLFLVVADPVADFSLSSFKILTTKMGELKSKIVVLEMLEDIIHWHKNSGNLVLIITETKLRSSNRLWIRDKFNGIRVFLSGLNKRFFGAEVTIIINTFLACYVCKVSEVPGWLLSIKLLFKNKLSVSILELYVRTSMAAVNKFLFVVLGGNFNKDGSQKCASFKKCLDLGLGNSLSGWYNVKMLTWANSQNMAKTIDFLFISSNLVNAVVDYKVSNVGEFFDTNHQTVFVSVGLTSVVQDVVDLGAGSDHIYSALFGARKFYHAAKLAESLRAKKTNIRLAIDRRMESFEVNKGHMIRNVLKHPFHKVDIIMEGWTRKCEVVINISNNWHCQYQLLEYVFNEIFSDIMSSIEFDELVEVVSDLLDGKAAGLLSVSNELWKHCNKTVLNMLLVLLNFCLSNSVLMNTYSIVLIETAHKILSKIFSDRIFLACSTFDVLYKDNFSVLKGMLTQSPIFAIGSVIENALEKNQKLWLHLKKSLVRIKMCSKFIQFFGSIHRNCTNRVITDFGLTDSYYVQNGLDQEEVFSSLLWCIFYDSLLCKARLSSFFAAGTFYLGIFFSTEGFSKPSLAKTNLNICFFINLVLRKAISNKQLLYLVSAILHPIVSFISVGVYNKWNALIHKNLKLKSGLPLDFPSNTIHHPSFYGLKSFLQVQSESKVWCWCSVHPLSFFVCVHVSASNNFLASIVCILLDCNLSLNDFLANFFQFCDRTPMFTILDKSKFFKFLSSFCQFDIVFCIFRQWKRLDFYGLVPKWFKISVAFLNDIVLSSAHFLVSSRVNSLSILNSGDFAFICNYLFWVCFGSLSVYINGSLKELGTIGYKAGTAAFFENINLGLGVGILSLLSSTMTELQTIVLALECVSIFSFVYLFSNSQSALDACKLELGLVKSYSGISENEHIDVVANTVFLSSWHLSLCLNEHFIVTNGSIISSNSRHFVHNIYCFVCHAHWEVESGFKVLINSLISEIDWLCLSLCLYNRFYPSVLCLYCGNVKVSDHVFSCKIDESRVSGFFHSSSGVLQLLLFCVFDIPVFMALCKSFIFNGWFYETVFVFCDPKITGLEIVRFSAEVIKLLSVTDAFGIQFGFHKFCLFFLGIDDPVLVYIAA